MVPTASATDTKEQTVKTETLQQETTPLMTAVVSEVLTFKFDRKEWRQGPESSTLGTIETICEDCGGLREEPHFIKLDKKRGTLTIYELVDVEELDECCGGLAARCKMASPRFSS